MHAENLFWFISYNFCKVPLLGTYSDANDAFLFTCYYLSESSDVNKICFTVICKLHAECLRIDSSLLEMLIFLSL